MIYTIQDIAGLLAAVTTCGVLLYLPGLSIARVSGAFGARKMAGVELVLLAPLIGTAILPAVDNLACTIFGLGTALALNLGLAAHGLVTQRKIGWPRPGLLAITAGGLWLALIAVAFVDLDWNGALYSSLLKIDAVKHAATVRVLNDAGTVPPADPFFLRAVPSGYYYFYYIVSALVERLGLGLIDQRAAYAGQMFWTGLALAGLVRLLLSQSGVIPSISARTGVGRPIAGLMLGVMAAGGLQIIPVVLVANINGNWLAQVNWWNDQVTSFPISLLWVPHHVAALIAIWVGLAALARALPLVERGAGMLLRDRASDWPRALAATAPTLVLAAFAFASAAGLSIWVAVAGAMAISLWLAALAAEKRILAIAAIAGVGVLALLIDLAYLLDLVAFRAYSGTPVAFELRPFPFTDRLLEPGALQLAVRAIVLPLDFLVEFGLLLIGTLLYWQSRPVTRLRQAQHEVERLLVATAIAGLFIATFMRSTIGNNDLGWRAALLPQTAFLVWTIAALSQLVPSGRLAPLVVLQRVPAAVGVMLVLGYVSIGYDLVGLRGYNQLGMLVHESARSDPRTDRDLRTAYTWLNGHVRSDVVVQHNPEADLAFGYGLYGRNRVAVSDHLNGYLFGAAKAEVEARVADLAPVFKGELTSAEAVARLGRLGIGAAVISAEDGVWQDKTSWVWSRPVLFSSGRVRVVDIGTGGSTP